MADVKELNINNTTYDIKAKSVVDQNSGSLKYWSGTQAQYDAIATKDTNTLYNVEGVGLYKGTTLISNDGANKDLSNLSSTGQAVIDAKVDNDDYYYKSGDTVTNLIYWGGGTLTNSGQQILFSIPLPKSLKNITTITCTALITGFRKSNGGYMPSSGGNGWNAKTKGTVAISKESDNIITVSVTYSSYGGTNNTPVGVWANISLSFT